MKRLVAVAAVAVVQVACVAAAVGPQLSGRLTGEDHLMEVRPLDPIDPFRGAYVTLDYPGLAPLYDVGHTGDELFVPLVEEDGYWVAASVSRTRPDDGPYLACRGGWVADCGIGSWFASQDRAAELERTLARRGGVATVRIDDRGHATVVDVR